MLCFLGICRIFIDLFRVYEEMGIKLFKGVILYGSFGIGELYNLIKCKRSIIFLDREVIMLRFR